VDALAQCGIFDLIIYGHTHQPDIRKVNKTVIINPGKASRLLRGKVTVAIMDLENMEVDITELR
jgi:putative phosphoesterase